MKYMLLFISDSAGMDAMDDDAQKAMFDQIGQWWGEHSAAGRIVGGEQLQPPGTATTVRFRNGKPLVSDGPYMEAKEAIGGFALLDVPDLDVALDLARTWPAKEGQVEVRPVVEH